MGKLCQDLLQPSTTKRLSMEDVLARCRQDGSVKGSVTAPSVGNSTLPSHIQPVGPSVATAADARNGSVVANLGRNDQSKQCVLRFSSKRNTPVPNILAGHEKAGAYPSAQAVSTSARPVNSTTVHPLTATPAAVCSNGQSSRHAGTILASAQPTVLSPGRSMPQGNNLSFSPCTGALNTSALNTSAVNTSTLTSFATARSGNTTVIEAAALAQSPQVLQISVGQRITYTARSNGMRYPGRVLGRLSGLRTGWRVLLDCGDSKEVDDKESWRLVKVNA